MVSELFLKLAVIKNYILWNELQLLRPYFLFNNVHFHTKCMIIYFKIHRIGSVGAL